MTEEPKSPHDKEEEHHKNLDEEDIGEEEEEDDEPKSPPSKIARLSSEPDPSAGIVTMASPSPLMLGLGLGMTMVDSNNNINNVIKPSFTFMQRQELEQQALIFSYMIRGIAVPLNLVLPIWKSVAASYGPHHYPSFVGLGNLCYDFRNSMEPEPGRCRRTDGKKWRCSRDVVPDQKYCERHMHRGRNRSRKPVEAAEESTSTVSVSTSATSVSVAVAAPNNNNNNNNIVTTATMGCSPTIVLSTAVKPVHIEE